MNMKSHIANKYQRGVAVIIVLLMVAAILTIVMTLTAIFAPKIHFAGDARRSVTAIYAADSGVEYCLYVNRKNIVPILVMANNSIVTTTNCNTPPVRATGTYQGVTRSLEVNF